MNWQKSIRLTVFALFLGSIVHLVASCGNAQPEPEEPSVPLPADTSNLSPLDEGKAFFVSYCWLCHGEDGKGGAMADLLKVPPPDLTQISARRNGVFPEEEVMNIISGKAKLEGHIVSDMPIWVATFPESEHLTDTTQLQEKFEHLALYLKSIQE